mgnify:CR=1 FL=1
MEVAIRAINRIVAANLFSVELEKDKTFRLTQIAKAIFAIVDAILIENKQYTSLYVDKKNLVKNFG